MPSPSKYPPRRIDRSGVRYESAFNADATLWAMNVPLGDNQNYKHAAVANFLLISLTRLARDTSSGPFSVGGELHEYSTLVRSNLGVFFGGIAYLEGEAYLARNTIRKYLDALTRCGVLYGGNQAIVTAWRRLHPAPGTPPQIYELNDSIGPADGRWLPTAFHEAVLWTTGKGASSAFASWDEARERLIPDHVRQQLDELHIDLIEYPDGRALRPKSSAGAHRQEQLLDTAPIADGGPRDTGPDLDAATEQMSPTPELSEITTSPLEPTDTESGTVKVQIGAVPESQAALVADPRTSSENGVALNESSAREPAPLEAGTPAAMEYLLGLRRECQKRQNGTTEKHSPAAQRIQELHYSTLRYRPTERGRLMRCRQVIQGLLDSGRPIDGEDGIWAALQVKPRPDAPAQELEQIMDDPRYRAWRQGQRPPGVRGLPNGALIANAGAAVGYEPRPDDGFPWAPQAVAT